MVGISFDTVLRLHSDMIAKFGGEPTIRDQGTLKMLAEAPYQSGFGMEYYPTVFDKAAKYLEGFARHQVFVDGNKRIALKLTELLLRLNGYDTDLTNKEAYKLVMYIANNKDFSIEQISEFLQSRAVSYKKDAYKADEIEKDDGVFDR